MSPIVGGSGTLLRGITVLAVLTMRTNMQSCKGLFARQSKIKYLATQRKLI